MRFPRISRISSVPRTAGGMIVNLPAGAILSNMTHHVDDGVVRIGHEESPDTPRFVRERIHDVEPTRDRTRMNVVDISDFDAYLGKNRRRIIIPHQTHLGSRI